MIAEAAMQIDISTVVAGASAILGVACAIVVAIGRFAMTSHEEAAKNREADLVRRISELEKSDDTVAQATSKKLDELKDALHREELATVRIDGELKLQSRNHDTAQRTLDAMVDAMVRRDEFDTRMDRVERKIDGIFAVRNPGSYSARLSPSSGTQSPPPPKDPRSP